METLFAFDKRNYQECQTAFRGPRNREYYGGDYSIESDSVIDVRADRKAVGACSIIRLRSRTRQFFRRTWTHIREDGTDVAVLCFVRRGWLRLSHQRGESVARPGDFIVTRSTTPFSVESFPGDDGAYELLHLTVPTHLLRRVLCDDVRTGFCVPAGNRKFALAERILTDLFEDAGEIKDAVAEQLVDAVLSVLSDAVRSHESFTPERQSLADRRLHDVLRFIETHLSDPKLSVVAVARGCGISPRYLSLLLRQHGTPFSALVWSKRLEAAGHWLSMSRSGEASISEIAYRVGFKSPAHFSRMFKREFKMSPRQYRAGAALRAEPQTVVVDGGESRH
ncbi:AraC family transcriptional regulator [Sinimarinibacterium flocculans]|uniref:AraC-like DNA-binding protein n=1 Tax=Sinimarinibacterium flocculans TaxID=985250 RepID=A0A318E8M1_9GAMM|nr:AraC family transcriptional regulator [Sinimarinibacterium flocculans]PXV68311.1 AraC-like DNA-binding protein [Sinimarinibacterium flocculans]